MDRIALQNFRCFRDRQTARLAPLTLLVGENSTGKTSFMAMIRALWDAAYRDQIPDFKEPPYDLGSFDEIAHHRGSRGGRAETFDAEFEETSTYLTKQKGKEITGCKFSITFRRNGTVPIPSVRRIAQGNLSLEQHFEINSKTKLQIGTRRGIWEYEIPEASIDLTQNIIRPFLNYFYYASHLESKFVSSSATNKKHKNLTKQEQRDVEEFAWSIARHRESRPYASAPVRSKPHRTYDPARPSPDPEGDYVPMHLADLYFRHKDTWGTLKEKIEQFGQAAGLFDEISIKSMGDREGSPFQVQIRKYGGALKGPERNLLDVGYGVSQILPVITELLRDSTPQIFLLQQPEVHLHPSAQAALGSLFCQVATHSHQLIVETHSDHILDRVRMDVRDGEGCLRPDDVSILFFERKGLDVQIHSLRLDEHGNILNTPPNYRRFFMEEQERSLGI